ncbi:MAG: hypothetical protein ACLR2O_16775 [Coprococcus sp.]
MREMQRGRKLHISRQDADYYATRYKKDGLTGGHIILLNPPASEYYDATKAQALKALHAYPGGMQIGGGITSRKMLQSIWSEGASHVDRYDPACICRNGRARYDRLGPAEKGGREKSIWY